MGSFVRMLTGGLRVSWTLICCVSHSTVHIELWRQGTGSSFGVSHMYLPPLFFMLFLPAEFCNASPGTASQSHFKIRFKLQASLWLPLFLTERRPTHNLTNEILHVSAEILYRCWQRMTLSIVGKLFARFLRDTHIKAFFDLVTFFGWCIVIGFMRDCICLSAYSSQFLLSIVTGINHFAFSCWHKLLASS